MLGADCELLNFLGISASISQGLAVTDNSKSSLNFLDPLKIGGQNVYKVFLCEASASAPTCLASALFRKFLMEALVWNEICSTNIITRAQ